jgi:hypothetical protein
MKIELYPMIDTKISESAKELCISPTELVNSILDKVKIIIDKKNFNSRKYEINEMSEISEADWIRLNNSLLEGINNDSRKSKKAKKNKTTAKK